MLPILQVPLALMILTDAAFQNNPMYETTSFSSAVMATSGGYFLYDSIECLVRIRTEGAEFLMHGVFCGLVYANLLRSGVMHFFGEWACCTRESSELLVPTLCLCGSKHTVVSRHEQHQCLTGGRACQCWSCVHMQCPSVHS